MADPDRPVAKASAFWGVVFTSARIHATTAELWRGINDAATASGVGLPAGMFQTVNRMRSTATALRNASERLGLADPARALTADHVGAWWWARPPTERALAPHYQVRFELPVTVAGQTTVGWYRLDWPGSLPATVGELMATLEDYAFGLGTSYGAEVGELGSVYIGEV